MTTNHTDKDTDIAFAAQESQETPQIKTVLPILPSSELVLFPRVIMPLSLWEEKAQKLVDDVILTDKIFGIVASREEISTGFGPDNLFTVGTAAVKVTASVSRSSWIEAPSILGPGITSLAPTAGAEKARPQALA